jgi:hypothetical protein
MLKRLAKAAYKLDAFKPNLTRAMADLRIARCPLSSNCLTSRHIHSEVSRTSPAAEC